MSGRLLLLSAVAAWLTATPAQALKAGPACLSEAAAEAVAVRVLQSELTVGALACHLPSRYARFVDAQTDALSRHADALTRHYMDSYGERAGQRRLDALVTRLANEASARKSGWRSGYCPFITALLDRAAGTAPDGLGRFAVNQPHAEAAMNAVACAPNASARLK